MKIYKGLMVAPFSFYPPQSGGEAAMFNHFRALASSFNLTLLVPKPDDLDHMEGLRFLEQKAKVYCVPLRPRKLFFESSMRDKIHILYELLFNKFFIGRLYEFYGHEITRKVLGEHFDLIQIEHSWWHHPSLRSCKGRLILMEHNYEYEYYLQLSKAYFKQKKVLEGVINLNGARLIRLQELTAIKDADLVLTLSDRITNQIKKVSGAAKIFTGAYGLNRETYESHFASSRPENEPNVLKLIYVGALEVFQTAEAALFFIQEIYPLIKRQNNYQFKFFIIGRNPIAELVKEAKKDSSIVLTGLVPDVREFISQADIYVVPLRYGSGIRIKVMEAMMMGKPIVSTSKGVEGLFSDNISGVIVADEPQHFADSILNLAKDKDQRILLGMQNRNYAYEYFDFEKNFIAKILPYYQRLFG